ncbi:MAG: DUF2490 domain-containing protein [Ferruginibacter sp.]
MKNFILTALLMCTGSTILYAQAQFTGWLASFNTFKLNTKAGISAPGKVRTSIHAEVQVRSADQLDHLQTLILRTGLNVHINKQLTLTAGYGYISNYRKSGNVDGYAPEHRIWEQLLYTHNIKKVLVAHRFRLEQRYISKTVVSNNELKTDSYVYANRIRYFLRNIIPLKKQPVFTKGPFAALQNEVFLNFGNTKNVNGKTFDQNRFYVATGYRFSKSFDLEAGYMNQYINGKGNAFTNNHIVQIAGYVRM